MHITQLHRRPFTAIVHQHSEWLLAIHIEWNLFHFQISMDWIESIYSNHQNFLFQIGDFVWKRNDIGNFVWKLNQPIFSVIIIVTFFCLEIRFQMILMGNKKLATLIFERWHISLIISVKLHSIFVYYSKTPQ